MKSHLATLPVATGSKQEVLDLTARIGEIATASGLRDGVIAVYSRHTTAGVFVGEYQAALNDDVLAMLERVVSDGLPYRHNSPEFSDCERKNAASHLRALLFSHSILLPLAASRPVLGRFQSIVFAELDGPRERVLQVQVFGE
jgi:secondary thiamine-phosphate synthase enzyme